MRRAWKLRRPDGALCGHCVTGPDKPVPTAGASAGDVLIDVRGVDYAIEGHKVFDGLNVSVRRGRITGIMGPSGTGKTTLLRLMTAQSAPDRGQVVVWGSDLATLSSAQVFAMRKRMG